MLVSRLSLLNSLRGLRVHNEKKLPQPFFSFPVKPPWSDSERIKLCDKIERCVYNMARVRKPNRRRYWRRQAYRLFSRLKRRPIHRPDEIKEIDGAAFLSG